MYKVLVILLVVFVTNVLCIPMMAQDKVEVFGGYEYLSIGNNNSAGFTSQGFNGFNAAGTFKFNRLLGVEGDFGGTYATVSGISEHVYTYTGGPVLTLPAPFIRPFVHVLVGGVQMSVPTSGGSASLNGFTTMFGGGVDAKVNHFLAIRIGQFDWTYYHFGNQTVAGTPFPSFSGSNNVRFSTGLVLRF